MDQVKSYEPVTKATVDMIRRTIGHIPAMFCNLGEVDIARGAGIIDQRTKCLWTKNGKRITISEGGGAVVASCSKEVDPNCPKGDDSEL